MKPIAILFLLTALFISSCGSNDDPHVESVYQFVPFELHPGCVYEYRSTRSISNQPGEPKAILRLELDEVEDQRSRERTCDDAKQGVVVLTLTAELIGETTTQSAHTLRFEGCGTELLPSLSDSTFDRVAIGAINLMALKVYPEALPESGRLPKTKDYRFLLALRNF